ncbi:hypothetical protein IGI04_039155 [Brassica rapa subsp. trilocularis]|uniref:Uncharacterized protein n=1 Tax=Brassica rapa subsp. trilocularis TaxID=1813537 RepID=A0ABQ7KJ35_BRACM|nr:hypothetical protein IGI04_039155 [Brassica rapa subsp. trilocularis]
MILTMFRTTPALSAKKRKAKRNITSDVCQIFIYKEEFESLPGSPHSLFDFSFPYSLRISKSLPFSQRLSMGSSQITAHEMDMTTTKTTIATRSVVKFEDGYSVETVFDGSKLGIEPYAVEVLPNGELLVLDYENSNIYKISSSLSLCKYLNVLALTEST